MIEVTASWPNGDRIDTATIDVPGIEYVTTEIVLDMFQHGANRVEIERDGQPLLVVTV